MKHFALIFSVTINDNDPYSHTQHETTGEIDIDRSIRVLRREFDNDPEIKSLQIEHIETIETDKDYNPLTTP